jgi:hypothetical protein
MPLGSVGWGCDTHAVTDGQCMDDHACRVASTVELQTNSKFVGIPQCYGVLVVHDNARVTSTAAVQTQ